MGIKIIGTGKYLPEKVITNEEHLAARGYQSRMDPGSNRDRTAKDRNDRKLAGHGGCCCGAGFAGESIRIPLALLL